ncbi:MAG: proteasome-activating nucleotidase, partial [Sulfolobus sp.]|nr:proteasome-activating nucleotidase [Sulfolobus sp.]
PAILRPGRFDRLIEVPLPDKRGRIEIFKIYLSKMKVEDQINLEMISELTEGFSGADIKNACVEAGYIAIRDNRNYVTQPDLLGAIDYIKNKRDKTLKIKERLEKFS